MHLDSLNFLVTIAQCGSTRKAAELLNTSSQNVSRVLKQLESEWDVTLFERTARGMSPTKEGQLALEFAKNTLKQRDELLATFHPAIADNKDISGQITIFASTFSNLVFLDQLLLEFMQQYPTIRIIKKQIDTFASLDNKQSDIALFCFRPRFSKLPFSVELSATKEVITLFSDQLVMLINASSPLAKQNSISMSKAMQQPLLITAQNQYEDSSMYHLMELYSGQVKTAPLVTNPHQARTYIAHGNFIVIATKHLYENFFSVAEKNSIKAVPIRDADCTVEQCLYIYNPQYLSTAEQRFVAFVKNYFHLIS